MRWLKRLVLALALLLALAVAGVYAVLRASLPVLDGELPLAGLTAPVEVAFDARGIPAISARTREDAYRALGYLAARDRLFQMDLMRRRTAGRLAEILGEGLSEDDRWRRVLGYEQVARAAVARLPRDQRTVLDAYAEGVNQGMASLAVVPFEFWLLGYRPEPWRPEDSLLVVLGMHESLAWSGDEERMATRMEAALPPAVFDFLLPDRDRYTEALRENPSQRRPPPPLPRQELAALLRAGPATASPPDPSAAHARAPRIAWGSNAWALSPSQTKDGAALLANDMHLPLGVPNLWYRARLDYEGGHFEGFVLPGVPAPISGSNGRIAWGFTNTLGDFVDLVRVEPEAEGSPRYRTPEGGEPFRERVETLRVKGGAAQTFTVRETRWGPVLEEPLLGRPVAVRWTALDPAAVDLKLLDLDRADDVRQALALFGTAGSPPLNALVADRDGNIGWTLAGKVPRRFGLDGLVSRSWADGGRGWRGYLDPAELPRRYNPAEGFIVSANQRMADPGYPYAIGRGFGDGHRALRIAERLRERRDWDEAALLGVQLDTAAEFYRPYQAAALSALDAASDADAEAGALKRELLAWDGGAGPDSRGLRLLIAFRRELAASMFRPLLRGAGLPDDFEYDWTLLDEPLKQWLEARTPELLPEEGHPGWNGFLLARLKTAARTLGDPAADGGPWGDGNRVLIQHPFSKVLPALARWLDMPTEPLAGCPACVRFYAPGYGASERLVVAPGREAAGILNMPTGQSGHPLSPFYADQQGDWVRGAASPLRQAGIHHRLAFRPAPSAGAPQ